MSTLPIDLDKEDPFYAQKLRLKQLEARREAARKLIADSQARLGQPLQTFSGGYTPLFGTSVAQVAKRNPLEPILGAVGNALATHSISKANKEEAEIGTQMDEQAEASRRNAVEAAVEAEAKKQRDALEALAEQRTYNERIAKQKQLDAIELKGVPQVIQSTSNRNTNVSGMPSGGSQPARPNREGGPQFGGPVTQIGIDPRTDKPVYRHTKSGALFTHGDDGSQVAHTGAVGPKPSANAIKADERLPKFDNALASAREFLKGYNPRNPAHQLNPEKMAQAQALGADLQLLAKDAYDMGAPQAGDLAMLEKVFASMTGLKAAYLGRGGIDKQLEMAQGRNAAAKPPGATPAGRVTITTPAQFNALPKGTQWQTPDGKRGTK